MDQISLYGLNRCSSCVKARKWLEDQGVKVAFTDYRDAPLPGESLLKWSQELGGWEKLVNRASMTWRNLPQDRKAPASDNEWLQLIAEFPTLVRRPLAIWPDQTVTVGFSEKEISGKVGCVSQRCEGNH